VSIALKPVAPVYLVKRKGGPQSFMKTCGEVLSRRPKEQKKQGAVIIERRGVQSWDFLYIGPWPVKESPVKTSSSRQQAAEWLLCIGTFQDPSNSFRKVLTLFANKWVVYDRYDKWLPTSPDSLMPSSQASQHALPPHTEMKRGVLELDAETLKWYATKEEERDLIAEKARAHQAKSTLASASACAHLGMLHKELQVAHVHVHEESRNRRGFPDRKRWSFRTKSCRSCETQMGAGSA